MIDQLASVSTLPLVVYRIAGHYYPNLIVFAWVLLAADLVRCVYRPLAGGWLAKHFFTSALLASLALIFSSGGKTQNGSNIRMPP